MEFTEFTFEFHTEVPHLRGALEDDLRSEAQSRLRALAAGHTDLIGASVALDQPAHAESPLQILFLNLVTDVFPALALGMGAGDPSVMERPPRPPDEPVMTRRHWLGVAGYGLTITAAVLGALALALNVLGLTRDRAVTTSFLVLAFAQLWHVFNMRDRPQSARGSGLLRNDVTRNPYVWGALALCIALLLAAVYVPRLAQILQVFDPGLKGWALVVGMSLIPLLGGQILKWKRVI